MKYYPIMVRLDGRTAVVVGGGSVALRKVKTLLEHGAEVVVIAPTILPDLNKLVEEGSISWKPETFCDGLLDELNSTPALVFGTTDNRDVNVIVSQSAASRGIPCNIADVPDLCSFIVPALMRRGDLAIAVSTGGASPALARRIRESLESRFGAEYSALVELLGALRSRIIAEGRSSDDNKTIFMKLVDAGLEHHLAAKDKKAIVSAIRSVVPYDIEPDDLVENVLRNFGKRG